MEQDHLAQITSLQQDLDAAQKMAFKMMSSGGEVGDTLQFIKSTFSASSFQELAAMSLDYLAASGYQSCLLFQGVEGPQFFTLNVNDEMIDRAFLSKHLDEGRIWEGADRVIINYEHCSLLVNNPPTDNVKRGELRDTWAILMDGIEAKTQNILLAGRAEEARNVKNAFFALMTHELKTPLNPIIGFSTHLARKLKDSLAERDLKAIISIRDNGEHMLRLLEDILVVTKLRNNEIILHKSSADLPMIVGEAMSYLEDFAAKNKVTVTYECDEELFVSVDTHRILDACIGLLSNAIKYSEGKSVEIKCVSEKHSEHEEIVITFCDTGKGIAEENQVKVFHHFSERDNPATEKKRSCGISLFLVNEIIGLHDGQVELESELGKGSCFTVRLPVQ